MYGQMEGLARLIDVLPVFVALAEKRFGSFGGPKANFLYINVEVSLFG